MPYYVIYLQTKITHKAIVTCTTRDDHQNVKTS